MLLVRKLVRSDLQELLALYAYLHATDEPLPCRKQVEAVWDQIMNDSNQLYFGGFVDNRLVSACNASVIPNLTRGAQPYAVVENVVTHASHRRQGIGSQVMRRLLDERAHRRCYKIMLMSSVDREGAHHFYELLGFDKTSKQAFILKPK